MPIFEYKCCECLTKFEVLILQLEQEVSCPCCGGKEVKKLFSTFSAAGIEAGSGCSGCSASSCSTCEK